MNLLTTLHTLWTADGTLNGLMDSNRLNTGNVKGLSPPYCMVSLVNNTPVYTFNNSVGINEATVRFDLWHTRRYLGLAIVNALKGLYHRNAFDLSGGDKVINMQQSGDMNEEEDNEAWHFRVSFKCLVCLADGV